MKKILIFAFFTASCTSLLAQTENVNNLIRDVDGRLNMGNYMTSSFDSRYEGLKGSPFFISEWISVKWPLWMDACSKKSPLNTTLTPKTGS
ncbi:hypothetical protein GVN20_16015 [Runella sp. CRIBMP]|uniref:hypothetical protein n=1 Tax=Runella sp. CRIBMP TaxID=2683261 RepID=UPI001412806C|nr:hypothetical protein [Runella sp. CRIBMP]NBB20875.1 hypothetical protein [Runella sp. CRIBMP]